ncbi:hypothetical protein BDK51DRAFT_35234 [Blyttiomyces helicus]|uniref:Uncharacterized protein n=1 Tax=Blyttiomyces helicus TaxID=388810 RepID=A0A4P9VY84_9FUNG|nr:hypothetical protein BDK51DRAFT_35234 [Blyttiomyces helicus]|eukprot:RKO84222.1 hypothetical protein BDK51DRAFT_35234 [Blyttiomyces helicus]
MFGGSVPRVGPAAAHQMASESGAANDEDDLYSFGKKAPSDYGSGLRTSGGRVLPTQGYTGGAPRTGRIGTSSGQDPGPGGRPMTSVRGAGYSSRGRPGMSAGQSFDPFNQAGRTPGGAGLSQPESQPEEQLKQLEKKVNLLIEESTLLAATGHLQQSLEKAKEAGKRERQLSKQRDQSGLADSANPTTDITYAVLFNLANQYHANKMFQEALNTYAVIVKNKLFNQPGKLRVNMGNIYFEMRKFGQAVKMYRMALDQIPSSNKDIR